MFALSIKMCLSGEKTPYFLPTEVSLTLFLHMTIIAIATKLIILKMRKISKNYIEEKAQKNK